MKPANMAMSFVAYKGISGGTKVRLVLSLINKLSGRDSLEWHHFEA